MEEKDREIEDEEDTFVCSNCGEEYTMEEHGTSELAYMDNVCIYCFEERGYGE